jgi:UDP:flavonoid glycosyltransferase YjiC (YdhE family)
MFAALAAFGHTYPSIPLARAARAAGHEVVFAAGDQFLPTLRDLGLTAVPAGMPIAEAFAGVARTPAGFGGVIGGTMARRWATDLAPLLDEHRPDLLVHDIATLGAPLAAAVAGIPALGHGFGRWFRDAMSEHMVSAFAELAAEHGLTDHENVLRGPVVDICPESVQHPTFVAEADRIPLRPTGFSPPGPVPARVSDRPYVLLTMGTAFGSVAALRQAIDGIATLPVDLLVTTGPTVDTAALGPLPDNVRAEAWVDQPTLLPHLDLIVHHGGSGTMLGAFAAGLPQLVLPVGADQFTNADAVVWARCGVTVAPEDRDPAAITAAAARLLRDDAVHAAADRVAAEIAAMPAPAEVVARVFR